MKSKFKVNCLNYRGKEVWKYFKTLDSARKFMQEGINDGLASFIFENQDGSWVFMKSENYKKFNLADAIFGINVVDSIGNPVTILRVNIEANYFYQVLVKRNEETFHVNPYGMYRTSGTNNDLFMLTNTN